MVAQGVALVANMVAPPLVVSQVVALVANMVALRAAPLEVRGYRRFLEVWVIGFLSG